MNAQPQTELSNHLIHLKQKQFTGKIKITAGTDTMWRIYLCLGRLVWTDGGIHSNRSWKRSIDKYCPQIDWDNFKLKSIDYSDCGDYYYILKTLLKRKLIGREQAIELVKNRATEILFDLLQLEHQQPLNIEAEIASTSSFLTSGLQMSISLVNIEEVLYDAKQAWLIWQQKGLQGWSPNLAPMMSKQDRLREEVSGIVYQNFLKLLDGQRTLRDLASRMGKDVRKLTSSLIPYVQQGLLDLIEVKDINPPLYISTRFVVSEQPVDLSVPLVACIDDSPQIGKIMKHLIIKCGYRFLSIQEPLQALPTLIQANPDLIFLDISMPIVNGYEICTQVRRVSKLRKVPIVMLTGNDGIIDRVRAKVAGANAFLIKPIEVDKITDILKKYMSAKPDSNSYSSSTPNLAS